jgi:hypothetical protein
MRLWSLHPSYLDTLGLVACWREGLLARKVLQGETKGYRFHPQILRFKIQADPIASLDQYLTTILYEATQRGFAFNARKITIINPYLQIPVTDGQLRYELDHLKAKLSQRDPTRCIELSQITSPQPNPIFRVVKGDIEAWEKVPHS